VPAGVYTKVDEIILLTGTEANAINNILPTKNIKYLRLDWSWAENLGLIS